MSGISPLVRPYQEGDAPLLRDVFLSAVHGTASGYYSARQIEAWAPQQYDPAVWQQKIAMLNPLVAVVNGRVVGYADIQTDGLIDHFFVAADMSRKGIGHHLMSALHEVAQRRAIGVLHAYVSLAAEAFFRTNGFQVVRRQSVLLRDIGLDNALMEKQL